MVSGSSDRAFVDPLGHYLVLNGMYYLRCVLIVHANQIRRIPAYVCIPPLERFASKLSSRRCWPAFAGMTHSFFPTPALDHAVAGIGAGVITTLCMNPLDLLKIKLQVMTAKPVAGPGKQIWFSLKEIYEVAGLRGLYRGLIPNIAGNAASWGLYFWFYNILKRRTAGDDVNQKLSAGAYLLCSAEASAATAILTNPLWLVRVRMFASPPSVPPPYGGLYDGLSTIFRTEGIQGWFKGTSLALVGVSNGAVQFVVYEKMKQWAFERKRKRLEKAGLPWRPELEKLSNWTYSFMSITSKLTALAVTYPYQVVRSRVQNNAGDGAFPDIPTTIKRTWTSEGIKGFYRGLGTNMIRVLPGTCITFVVYENLAWLLRSTAVRREARQHL